MTKTKAPKIVVELGREELALLEAAVRLRAEAAEENLDWPGQKTKVRKYRALLGKIAKATQSLNSVSIKPRRSK